MEYVKVSTSNRDFSLERGSENRRGISLWNLPQPLHLFQFLTGSRHYHFGCFVDSRERLHTALDRLPMLYADRFSPHGPVLDVGCGLGGTTQLLAERGADVLGIDPCRRAIRFARSRTTRQVPARFAIGNLDRIARHAARRGAMFGGVLLTEVSQHFDRLGELLTALRSILHPSGAIVVNDVFTVPRLPRSQVPLHRRGSVETAAASHGLEVSIHRDLTAEAAPTLPRLIERLLSSRDAIVRHFAPQRPAIEAEVDELVAQLRGLESGFANGDLTYEVLVLRPEPLR